METNLSYELQSDCEVVEFQRVLVGSQGWLYLRHVTDTEPTCTTTPTWESADDGSTKHLPEIFDNSLEQILDSLHNAMKRNDARPTEEGTGCRRRPTLSLTKRRQRDGATKGDVSGVTELKGASPPIVKWCHLFSDGCPPQHDKADDFSQLAGAIRSHMAERVTAAAETAVQNIIAWRHSAAPLGVSDQGPKRAVLKLISRKRKPEKDNPNHTPQEEVGKKEEEQKDNAATGDRQADDKGLEAVAETDLDLLDELLEGDTVQRGSCNAEDPSCVTAAPVQPIASSPTTTTGPIYRSIFSSKSSTIKLPNHVPSSQKTTSQGANGAASLRPEELMVFLQPLTFRWRLLMEHLQSSIAAKFSPDSTEYQLLWCLLPRLLELEIQQRTCGGASGDGSEGGPILPSLMSHSSRGWNAATREPIRCGLSQQVLKGLVLKDLLTFSFVDACFLAKNHHTTTETEAATFLIRCLMGGESLEGSPTNNMIGFLVLPTPEELQGFVMRKCLQRLVDSCCLTDIYHYHWWLLSGGGAGGRGGDPRGFAQIAADHLRGVFLFPVTDDIAPRYSSCCPTPMSLFDIYDRLRRSTLGPLTTVNAGHGGVADIATLEELLDDLGRIASNADSYHGASTVIARKANNLVATLTKPVVRKRLVQYYLTDRWSRHILSHYVIARSELSQGGGHILSPVGAIRLCNSAMALALTEDTISGLQQARLVEEIHRSISTGTELQVDAVCSLGVPEGSSLDTLMGVANPFVFIGGTQVHSGTATSSLREATSGNIPGFSVMADVDGPLSPVAVSSRIRGLAATLSDKMLAPLVALTTDQPYNAEGSKLSAPLSQALFGAVAHALSSRVGGNAAAHQQPSLCFNGLTVSKGIALVTFPGHRRGEPVPVLLGATPLVDHHPSSAATTTSGGRTTSRANKEAAEKFSRLTRSYDHQGLSDGLAKVMPTDSRLSRLATKAAAAPSSAPSRPQTRRQLLAASKEALAEPVPHPTPPQPTQQASQSKCKANKGKESAAAAAAAASGHGAINVIKYHWAECSCGSWRLVKEEMKNQVTRGEIDFKCKMVRKRCNTADDVLPRLEGKVEVVDVTSTVDEGGGVEEQDNKKAQQGGRKARAKKGAAEEDVVVVATKKDAEELATVNPPNPRSRSLKNTSSKSNNGPTGKNGKRTNGDASSATTAITPVHKDASTVVVASNPSAILDGDSDDEGLLLLSLAPVNPVIAPLPDSRPTRAAPKKSTTVRKEVRSSRKSKTAAESRSSSISSSSSGDGGSDSSSSSSGSSSSTSSGGSNPSTSPGDGRRARNNSSNAKLTAVKKGVALSSAAATKRDRDSRSIAPKPSTLGVIKGTEPLQQQVSGTNFQMCLKSVEDPRRQQLYANIKRKLDELDIIVQNQANLRCLPHALHHAVPSPIPTGKSLIDFLKPDVSGRHPAPPRPPPHSPTQVTNEYAGKLTWGSLGKDDARNAQIAQRTLLREIGWCRAQLGLDRYTTQTN